MAIPMFARLGAETPVRRAAETLAARPSLPPLVPRDPYDAGLRDRLLAIQPETMLGDAASPDAPGTQRPHDTLAVLSGLLLWNDCLPDAHTLCQGIETENGSYWHGILHRREPDYSNSKYWFRRVGPHPIFPALREAALESLRDGGHGFRWATETAALLESSGAWDPFAFVDWCQACDEGVLSPPTRALLEQIQLREIELLLDHCLRGALGTSGVRRE
jgi:hypothetical protein